VAARKAPRRESLVTAIAQRLPLPEPLERLFPAAGRALRFGIPALDALLPGGVPRGQLTLLEAPLGSGGTALLLALAGATLRSDEAVALVDAERSLAPQAAAHLSSLGQFWVVRPQGPRHAWWCADVLLRTGAFGLVIVDQPPPPPTRGVTVRLQRLARDKDAALMIRAAQPHGRTGAPVRALGAAVRLCVRARCSCTDFIPGLWGHAWPAPRALRITVEKGGAPRAAEVTLGIALPDRLRPHWAVRDRRAGRTAGRPNRSRR
jgi:hypothetical protein